MDSKRTERLVSALYLITSFFDEREPMKWRLRELGGEFISRPEHKNIVLEIVSLLNVGKHANLISDTNFEIIHREFLSLPSQQGLKDFFKHTGEAPLLSEKPQSSPSPVIKDKSREFGPMTLKKNSRQESILGLLKRKNEVMIRDVSPLIPGVSEKTIQRELLAMVHTGILRKIGEKRWSRYSLAE